MVGPPALWGYQTYWLFKFILPWTGIFKAIAVSEPSGTILNALSPS